MGWWRIGGSDGGIDFTRSQGGLLNKGPDDPVEDHYNGDGPANLMGYGTQKLLMKLGKHPTEDEPVEAPTQAEMLDLFLNRNVPEALQDWEEDTLEIVRETWDAIDQLYNEEWDRPPYDEEREAVCNFVMDPQFA